MTKCIYCLQEKNFTEFNKEHVIPESFGSFGNGTPKLRSVCEKCNTFFGKKLDLLFARETIEGITRYKNNLKSRETRYQKNIILTLFGISEIPDLEGVRVGIDGRTNTILPPFPQVLIKKETELKYESILFSEFQKFDWNKRGYLDKKNKLNLLIFGSSQEEHDKVVKGLKEVGINYNKKKEIDVSPLKNYEKLELNISGLIDHSIKRALAKILFNFSAFYMGEDEVFKEQWNKARDYIRHNGVPLKVRVTNNSFWGEETKNLRYVEGGCNIRIENVGENLVGAIQFFNLYLYEFILIENYNIPIEKEACYKFVAGKEPVVGKKYKAIEIKGRRMPIL